MNFTNLVGTLAGIFTTLAVLPQVIKSMRAGKVNDISLLTYIIICTGVALWTVYGFLKADLPIIITNGICLLLNCIMLCILLSQKK